MQFAYPLLAEIIKKYCCVPGSSIASEFFSIVGDIVGAQRAC